MDPTFLLAHVIDDLKWTWVSQTTLPTPHCLLGWGLLSGKAEITFFSDLSSLGQAAGRIKLREQGQAEGHGLAMTEGTTSPNHTEKVSLEFLMCRTIETQGKRMDNIHRTPPSGDCKGEATGLEQTSVNI